MDETKVCTKCGEAKPLDAFYFNASRGRHHAKCTACTRQYQRAYARAMHQLAVGNKTEPLNIASILNGRQQARGGGDLTKTTNEAHRDDAIAALFAASRRWAESSDPEDRAGARDAVVFRARQLVEAQGRCEE